MTQFGGIDWVTVQAALQAWVVGGTGLPSASVYWGQQDSPRVIEPAVEMRIYNQTQLGLGQIWLDRESRVLSVATLTVTAVDATANTLTIAGHGLVTGDGPVRLASTATLPAGLVDHTDYWVIVVDPNTVRLAGDYFSTGGNFPGNPITPLDITSSGSGTVTMFGDARTRRAGQEITYLARAMERCVLNLECHTTAAVGMGMAMSLLHGVVGRRMLPSQQAILRAANVGVESLERVRAVHGVRNALMFEPRATLQVYFSVPSEASEMGTIIQRATGTTLGGRPFVIP
jgi:hypothetical protein